MGIEAIGSIGSAVGSVASAVGRGVSSVGRISVEASAPAAALSGVGKLSGFGLKLEGPLTTIVNEGPVNLADLKNTVPLGEIRFNEPLSVPDVLAEAEVVISQAQKPVVFSPVTLNEVKDLSRMRVPNKLGDSSLVAQNDNRMAQDDKKVGSAILPQVEPMIVPFPALNIIEFLQPQAKISPVVEPLVQPEAKPIVLTQPALEEQKTKGEEVNERVAAKQIDIGEEEKEEVRLKNVVDEKVLEIRIAEFGSAADRVEAKAKESDLEEIRGSEIVGQVPVETEDKRSGLVKKSGPDGSREETIEEVGSRKFKSIKEAREVIAAIIFKKPPVKKEKEGEEVRREAVARVLKYRMVKSGPEAHTEAVKRVVKKQLDIRQSLELQYKMVPHHTVQDQEGES